MRSSRAASKIDVIHPDAVANDAFQFGQGFHDPVCDRSPLHQQSVGVSTSRNDIVFRNTFRLHLAELKPCRLNDAPLQIKRREPMVADDGLQHKHDLPFQENRGLRLDSEEIKHAGSFQDVLSPAAKGPHLGCILESALRRRGPPIAGTWYSSSEKAAPDGC